MPCVSPPWTWPSTIIGFTCTPMSSTATYFRTFVMPVSVSASTAHRWAVREGKCLRVNRGYAEQVRVGAMGQVVRGERLPSDGLNRLRRLRITLHGERPVD